MKTQEIEKKLQSALINKELTNDNIALAVFSGPENTKLLAKHFRRLGSQSFTYRIVENSDSGDFAIITFFGNQNVYVGLEYDDNKYFVTRVITKAERQSKAIESLSPRPAGRPVGSGEDRNIIFRLRLTENERELLNKLASEAGETPSQYVRSKIF